MSLKKRRILTKFFVTSQFNYCPLIWMAHNRYVSNKINYIHERALRLVYNDSNSNFEELLIKNKSVKIHHRNVRQLAIETLIKYFNLQLIMPGVFDFTENNNFNLSSGINLSTSVLQTSQYGRESIPFRIYIYIYNTVASSFL